MRPLGVDALAPAGTRSSVADGDAIFCSAPWFELLARHGFPHGVARLSMHLGSCEDGAVLHLIRTGDARGVEALANYYSGLYGPVGSWRGLSALEWLEAVRIMRRLHKPLRWHLHPVDEQSPWLQALSVALERSGYMVGRQFVFGNRFQPVPPGGFEVYWATRPSALRNTVARARKRLDRHGDWHLEIVTGERPGLDAAIGAYVSVYNRSWKTPEPNPAFMPGLIRLAAQQGWLRLGLVHVAGEPVAAQLWLVAGGKANIFKLAYVKGQEKLSAGSVLTADLMRHVMDVDGVQEVDFLSGDDPYKADWMEQRRERIGLVAFDKRHWRGWLAATRHRLGQWRRSWRQPA